MSTDAIDSLHSSIRTLIHELYQQAEIPVPEIGMRRRITPLGELIGSLNLACAELPELSQQTAIQYLQMQGALVEATEVSGHDALAGFLYTYASNGCIFVEAGDPLVRRRFSAAHELGHYLLHFRPLLDITEKDQEYLELKEVLYRNRTDDPQDMTSGRVERPLHHLLGKHLPPEERMEYEANQFATELLMPEEIVRGLFARAMLRFRDDDLVSYVATELLVSQEAVRWRLKNYGLLPLPEHRSNERKRYDNRF